MKKSIAIIALAAAATLPLTGCQNLIQNDPVTCKVIDKDRSTSTSKDGHNQSVFRIYTEGCGSDNETLGLADNFLAGNFNASDMYAKIKVGETYTFKTVGVRNGFASSFREITKMDKVVTPTATPSATPSPSGTAK